MFAKEYDSGLYGVVAYFFSKLALELPLLSFFPLMFVSIVYWWVGFARSFVRFLRFALMAILEVWVGSLIGILFGSMVLDITIAIGLSPLVYSPQILFSGFSPNTETIPLPLKILEYTSPLRYSFEFFVRNEFEAYDNLGDADPINTLNFSIALTTLPHIL